MKKSRMKFLIFILCFLGIVAPTLQVYAEGYSIGKIKEENSNYGIKNYKESIKKIKDGIQTDIEFEFDNNLVKIKKIANKNGVEDYTVIEGDTINYIKHYTKNGSIELNGKALEIVERTEKLKDYVNVGGGDIGTLNQHEYNYINTHYIDLRLDTTIEIITTTVLGTIISIKCSVGFGVAFTIATGIKALADLWKNSNAIFLKRHISHHYRDHWKYLYHDFYYYDSAYKNLAHYELIYKS